MSTSPRLIGPVRTASGSASAKFVTAARMEMADGSAGHRLVYTHLVHERRRECRQHDRKIGLHHAAA